MGQKINPVSLRLQSTNRHFDSCWYSHYFYKTLLTRELVLQQYFDNFLKLLKLPTGRYSVQHLQKTTQIYNFFCYAKATRDWRSQVFGLTKRNKSFKRSKFFLKLKFQKKLKKFTKAKKLIAYYTTLNQFTLYKMQRKITCFQNFHLWSGLIKQPNLETKSQFMALTSKSINQDKPTTSQYFQIKKLKRPFQNNKSLPRLTTSLDFSKKSRKFAQYFINKLVIYKILKSTIKHSSLSRKNNQEFAVSRLNKDSLLKYQQNPTRFTTQKIPSVASNFLSCKSPFTAQLTNYLEYRLSSLYKLEMNLRCFKVKNDWQYAQYLADELIYFLQKRVPFRRLKNKLIKQLSSISHIRGVRITCSGRVGGKSKKAQRAKTECIKAGQTSLQVFSRKIDFSSRTAFTSFGSVGVKVWICYN